LSGIEERMLTKTIAVCAFCTIAGAGLAAQQRPAQPTPSPAAPRATPSPQERGQEPPAPARSEQKPRPERAPEPAGQPVNIKLEINIADQAGPGEPTKKTVTMIVSDRQPGSIRSRGNVRVGGRWENVTINVDGRAVLLREGQVRVDLGLEYQPRGAGDGAPPAQAGAPSPTPNVPPLEPSSSNLNQRISVVLESGKPLVVSQAADPASDRRITVELKATVLK
jgi:hypothetical protein